MTNSNYIQLFRSPETYNLLEEDPKAYLLLSQIALRAKRTDGFSAKNLEIGEAFIGDHEKIGLTQGEYRGAKKRLEKYGFASFRPTNKGTIAKLISSSIFDINEETKAGKKPNKQQSEDKQRTTNNKDKNDNNEKKRGSILNYAKR